MLLGHAQGRFIGQDFRHSPSFSKVLNLVFRPFGQVRNMALMSLMMMTRMEEKMMMAVMTNFLAMVMT